MQDHINSRSLQFRIDLLPTFNRIVDVQNTVNACCDFTSQSIIVRIDHSNRNYHPFIHLNLQRSIVVGSCGEKIFVSLLFLKSFNCYWRGRESPWLIFRYLLNFLRKLEERWIVYKLFLGSLLFYNHESQIVWKEDEWIRGSRTIVRLLTSDDTDKHYSFRSDNNHWHYSLFFFAIQGYSPWSLDIVVVLKEGRGM